MCINTIYKIIRLDYIGNFTTYTTFYILVLILISLFSDNGKEEINRLKAEADNANCTPYEVPFLTGVFLHFLSIF